MLICYRISKIKEICESEFDINRNSQILIDERGIDISTANSDDLITSEKRK